MGVTHLAAICRTLDQGGKAGRTPAAVIESGTLAGSAGVFEGTLATIAEEARAADPPPCSPGRRRGRRATARARRGTSRFPFRAADRGHAADRTRQADRPGARSRSVPRSCSLPPSEILPVADPGPLDDAIGRLPESEWLVFTSGNGVRFFLERL